MSVNPKATTVGKTQCRWVCLGLQTLIQTWIFVQSLSRSRSPNNVICRNVLRAMQTNTLAISVFNARALRRIEEKNALLDQYMDGLRAEFDSPANFETRARRVTKMMALFWDLRDRCCKQAKHFAKASCLHTWTPA